MSSQTHCVYKLLRRSEWETAIAAGAYAGSADDARDGFIHFSTAEQLAETARKYFHGLGDLVLLTVDAGRIAPLRWEPARGGQLFPHLYGPLPVAAVLKAEEVATAGDGALVLTGLAGEREGAT